MVVEIAAVVAGVLVTVLVGSPLAGVSSKPAYPFYAVSGGITAYLMYPAVVSLLGAIAIPAIPLGLLGLVDLRNWYRRRRALSGGYGEATQWAAQIVDEGEDQHFVLALTALPKEELMEVGIIADTKEEMREMVKERFEKRNADNPTDPIEEML